MTAFIWEKWKSEDYQSEKEWQSVTSLEFRGTPCMIFQKFQRFVRLQRATIYSPGQLNLGAGWLFLIPTSISLWKVLSVIGTPQWFLVADAKLPRITVQPITKISKKEKKICHSTPPSHLWKANGKYLQKSIRPGWAPSPTCLVISPSFLHLSDFYLSHWWPLCGQTLLMDLSSNNLSHLLNKITVPTTFRGNELLTTPDSETSLILFWHFVLSGSHTLRKSEELFPSPTSAFISFMHLFHIRH